MRPLHLIIDAQRETLGLSVADVHRAIQRVGVRVGYGTVAHWFTGERRPRDMKHLRALCKVLRISVDEATGGEPNVAATGEEAVWLESFRTMDDEQQKAALLFIQAMRQAKGKP